MSVSKNIDLEREVLLRLAWTVYVAIFGNFFTMLDRLWGDPSPHVFICPDRDNRRPSDIADSTLS